MKNELLKSLKRRESKTGGTQNVRGRQPTKQEEKKERARGGGVKLNACYFGYSLRFSHWIAGTV